MKKTLLSSISFLLVLCMMAGALAACIPSQEQETTNNSSSSEGSTESSSQSTESSSEKTESSEGSSAESESESESGDIGEDTQSPSLDGISNGAIIENANALMNGVQAYFPYPDRSHFAFENKEMSLDYALSNNEDQQVTSLKNKDGHTYISNTMDVFVTMENGKTYYASKSTAPTTANIYRFGYYFYEMRLEEQLFVNDFNINDEKRVLHTTNNIFRANQIDSYEMNGKELVVKNSASATDSYIIFGKSYLGFEEPTSKYNYIKISLKVDEKANPGAELYVVAGSGTAFSAKQKVNFNLQTDNEVHDYYIPIYGITDFSGSIKGLRLDVTGAGSTWEIHELKLISTDIEGSPDKLALNRSFNVYSDKMHHTVQIAATEKTTGIVNVGMKTQIAADTVSAVVVEDKDGVKYSFDNVDWATVKYVGFDIKDAGIFGYILPYDGSGGTIEVTLADGVYTILQTKIPTDGTIIPSRGEFSEKDGYYLSVVPHNENDFYMSQRIYTDSNHSFDEFLYEAYCEIHPLSDKNVNISTSTSSVSSYVGYDAARGIYKFIIEGAPGGFNTAYYTNPNKHYNITFTLKGDDVDRNIYMMTYTTCGALESAVLLDKNKMMLPVPIEVGKNFSEASGERNLFNINDETYGEAIFPMSVKANDRNQYTIINLYQRWGNYPLKQISWIQFTAPYYHLSTGVTETNCILPWFSTKGYKSLNTLPDFRTMSASFWASQPQHESCGVHLWLIYTDSEGNYVTSENTADYIDSYGPVYADVKMENISDDGKIKVTYVHTEMPQLDENRTYYEITYEVLEDVTINDFRNNFQFYSVGPRNSGGYYKKIGYLGTDGKSHYVDAITENNGESQSYVLGENCPYFSFFDMDGLSEEEPGYANVAALIYNSDFVIGGEKLTPNFIINNVGRKITLSLDLGNVTLKAGDKITINMILLPWGSQEIDPDFKDVGDVHYYTVINEATGEQYLDKNVRDVRENSILNPLKATADKDCEVIESVFLPKLKSTNGKTAEFTLSGGNNNVAVRIYGFDKLTAPKVEEYKDGKWVEYTLNSSKNPDGPGYIHYYDGYSVHYDGDGTFSYAFIVTMDNGAPRKFRISAAEDFKNWPSEPVIQETREDFLKVFVDPYEIRDTVGNYWVSKAELSEDGSYVSLFGTGPDALNHKGEPVKEGYISGYRNDSAVVESGHILVIKYRIPTTNSKKIGKFEFYTSTMTANISNDNRITTTDFETDGKWHVLIIDLSKVEDTKFTSGYTPGSDGKYYAQILRWDFFDSCMETDDYVDVEFFGLHNDFSEIIKYLSEHPENETSSITLIEGSKVFEVNEDGSIIDNSPPVLKSFISPECTQYRPSTLHYAACVDGVNGKTLGGGANSKIMATNDINVAPITLSYNGTTIADASYTNAATLNGTNLVVSGWVVVEGGVDKYVWSVDGGKTWNDCKGYNTAFSEATQNHLNNAANRLGLSASNPFNLDTDEKNSVFQGLNSLNTKGINANLSAYVGQTVHVIFAAVPAADTNTLCLIAQITNVKVVEAEEIVVTPSYNEYVKEGSGYSLSNLEFGGCIDRVITTKSGIHMNSKNGPSIIEYNGSPIAAAGTPNNTTTPGTYLVFSGWSIVIGGVQKYVWSADGGQTWNDTELYGVTGISNANDAILTAVNTKHGLQHTFTTDDAANGAYQAGANLANVQGIAANLANYSGQTVDVIFAAVPKAEPDKLCIITIAKGVQVP